MTNAGRGAPAWKVLRLEREEVGEGGGEVRDRQVAPLAAHALFELDHAFAGALADDDLHGAAEQIGVLELDARAHVAVVVEHLEAGPGQLGVQLLGERLLPFV